MRWKLVIFASFLFSVGCSGELECLIDVDCQPEQYCAQTKCVSSEPTTNVVTAYTEQVRPLLNEGCSCHQDIHNRPWSFSERSTDTTVIQDDMSALKMWGYDPLKEEGFDERRPTLTGFALAECGFNHPGIYANRIVPKNTLLRRFLTDDNGLEAPPSDTADNTPLEFETGAQLPELEREVLDLIRVDEPRAFATEILPRIIGQCGCCHRLDGDRAWRIPHKVPSDAEGIAAAREQVLGMWVRSNPKASSFVTYGLGRGGGATLHPKVYRNERDPRLKLLIDWVSLIPPETPEETN